MFKLRLREHVEHIGLVWVGAFSSWTDPGLPGKGG
jgi:hypothetical protein